MKSRARRAPTAPERARARRAGLLLHPTSLPGPFPIGDLGPTAHALLDWLVDAGLGAWQVLPLGPTGYGDSPYHAHSSFAGNPLLISPEALRDDALLTSEEIGPLTAERAASADYSAAQALKQKLHRRGKEAFARSPLPGLTLQWKSFVSDSLVRSWLDDWSLYAALKARFGGKSWIDWDPELRGRKPRALENALRELAPEIELAKFVQFLFFRQWRALRAAAEKRGIELIGDLPIYPALDSADVWANRRLFDLGRDGHPRRVAGVPPDYFSESGQLWGNPLYRWDTLAESGFAWWVERVRWQLRLFHRLRLDHFRGFVSYWEVPVRAATAAKGRWRPGPGRTLFDALARALGGVLPFLAEDLGEIDEPVHALRRRLRLPGMRVLQFGFAADDSLHAPHRHSVDSVVYTGTHDNDTSRGWLATAPAEVKHRALTYLGTSEADAPWTMVRAALTSAAELAIVPLQDLLGLGSEARMNTPARESGNWTWRVRPDQIPADLPRRLRDLVIAASRTAPQLPEKTALSKPAVPSTTPT